MGLRKSKLEILDKIITKSELGDDYYWGYWDWDDDDYNYNYYSYCDNCGSNFCDDYSQCQTYEYQEEDDNKVIYVSRSFGRWHVMSTPKLGKLIDMNTIYSKEVIRQKKINYLLGIDKYEIQLKPTIGDSYNEKRGNI
jgi:hypothetical protein